MPKPLDLYIQNAHKRLLSKVDAAGDCWLWTASLGGSGYGQMFFKGKLIGAHRVSWMIHNGEIPTGMVVAHRCDTPRCVKPAHLFLTTTAGNLADMRRKGRRASGDALSQAIKAGWTPEKRKRRAEQTRERLSQRRRLAALAAGVNADWKRCPACDTWKLRSAFNKNRARKDGIDPQCRLCQSAKHRALKLRRRNTTE